MNVRVIGTGRRHVAFLTVLAIGAFAAMAMATDEDPKPEAAAPAPKAEASKLPPSTNSTQRVLYANEGQTEEQQMVDQLECYRWASDQTGWDPYEPYDEMVELGCAVAQTAEEAQGGLVRGAARGATAGAVIGAIAGDAGKGAAIGAAAGGIAGRRRSKRATSEAQSEADLAIEEFNRQLEKWDRNYAACMGGKNYTVE